MAIAGDRTDVLHEHDGDHDHSAEPGARAPELPAALAAAGGAGAADEPVSGDAGWVALALVLAALGLTARARRTDG